MQNKPHQWKSLDLRLLRLSTQWDFPAAHSMDADWFGIDEEGHVGVFGSGEEGAVPDPRPPEGDSSDLLQLVMAGVLRLDIEDLVAMTATSGRDTYIYNWRTGGYELGEASGPGFCLVRLNNESAFEIKEAQRAVADRWAHDPAAVTVLQRIPHDKYLLGVIDDYQQPPRDLVELFRSHGWLENAWYGFHFSPARCGLFEFHQWDVFFPGPYVLVDRPRKPFHVDASDERHQQRFGECRLKDVRFVEDHSIQPMSHTECATWGDRDWVDVDGKMHWVEPREEGGGGPTRGEIGLGENSPSNNDFQAILGAYLAGASDAVDVLNDDLEDRGLKRCVTDGSVEHRLNVVLKDVFPRALSHRLAVDFVEHAQLQLADDQRNTLVNSAIQLRREFGDDLQRVRPPFRPYALDHVAKRARDLGEMLERAWEHDNSPAAKLVWAAWTLIYAQPWNTAAAAREVASGELGWQLAHVKAAV